MLLQYSSSTTCNSYSSSGIVSPVKQGMLVSALLSNGLLEQPGMVCSDVISSFHVPKKHLKLDLLWNEVFFA